MNSKVVYGMLLVFSCCFVTSVLGNRGDKLKRIFKYFTITPKPAETGPVIRVPRNWKFLLHGKFHKVTTRIPTTTTTTTTTKSPEQIQAEKEAEMRRRNPKGFLIGNNKEKNKDKERILGTIEPETVEEQIKVMEKKLKSMETTCVTNDDCTNTTCCLTDKDGIGRCKVRPHRIGQLCTEMCACVNKLECRIKEVDQEKGQVTTERRCSVKKVEIIDKDSSEYVHSLLQRLRKGKKNVAKGIHDDQYQQKTKKQKTKISS